MAITRYKVSVCIAPGIPGYEGSPPSVDHEFSCRSEAIRFAKAISHYFVKPDPKVRQGLTSMWAIVYTLPATDAARRTWGDKPLSFTCIDPGAVILWDRSSEIPEGFYGASPARCPECGGKTTRDHLGVSLYCDACVPTKDAIDSDHVHFMEGA